MLFFSLFIIELVCLFFLSRMLTQLLSSLLLRITRSHDVTIHTLSFLFLPGVVVHELSHMFMASILFVHTGAIEFWPQIHGNTVKLGSVQVAKTDPFRRFLIGAAPLIGGVGIIMLLFVSFSSHFSHFFSWQIVVFIYALFEIGNTMFSSKKDMEGAIILFAALFLVVGLLFVFGFRFDMKAIDTIFSLSVISFFQKLDSVLLIPVILNSIFCACMKYFLKRVC